jgi:hypothetical protein
VVYRGADRGVLMVAGRHQKRHSRLVFGDYGTPQAARDTARVLFLATVAEKAPQVLASLRDVLPAYVATYDEVAARTATEPGHFEYVQTDTWSLFKEKHPHVPLPDPLPFPAEPVTVQRYVPGAKTADPEQVRLIVERYRRAYGERLHLSGSTHDVQSWHAVGAAELLDGVAWYPDLLPLRRALEAWAHTNHVQEPWVYAAALEQLDLWRQYPTFAYPASPWPRNLDAERDVGPEPDRLDWVALSGGGGWSALTPDECRFVFEHGGWDPTWTPRGDAEAAIRAAFELRLREHLDGLEERAASTDGFEKAAEYRSLQNHVVWLVRYQVLRETWPAIAATGGRELAGGRQVPVTDGFVARKVKELAELLGLRLAPVRGRGQPAGSRTVHTRDHHDTRSRPHRRRRGTSA